MSLPERCRVICFIWALHFRLSNHEDGCNLAPEDGSHFLCQLNVLVLKLWELLAGTQLWWMDKFAVCTFLVCFFLSSQCNFKSWKCFFCDLFPACAWFYQAASENYAWKFKHCKWTAVFELCDVKPMWRAVGKKSIQKNCKEKWTLLFSFF